ncbi:MAG: acyltransferase [Gammaproteobacteria bacterium]|nr:acyltransferase [Gammaproteobacteria bacterium]
MRNTQGYSFYIPSLDGIRALAAMLVFVAHAGWGYIVPGGFGVTIFFFLSGYLITTLLRRELEHTGSISFKKFYLRRAYRIFPPLYVVLVLFFLLGIFGVAEHKMRLEAVLSQVFFLTNYYSIEHGGAYFVPATGVYWSLAVEEHFYLVFPLLFWAAARRKSFPDVARLFLVMCVAVLAWRMWLVFEHAITWRHTYSATDARFDSLLFGCILGVWRNPVSDPEWKIGGRDRSAYLILVGALMLLLITFIFRDERFRETLRYTVQGIALLPIFWLAVRHPEWLVFRWMNWRPVRFFGVVSFSFYLCHGMALDFADQVIKEQIPRALLGFVFALLFATSMYFLVERPFAKLRRRLHRD